MNQLTHEQQVFVLHQIRNWVFGHYAVFNALNAAWAPHGAEATSGTEADAMLTLARFSAGRVVLHFLAMLGDREFRFHGAGILRELVSR